METQEHKRFAVFAHSPNFECVEYQGGIYDIHTSADDKVDAIICAMTLNQLNVYVFDFDQRRVVWDRSWPNASDIIHF